MRKIKKIEPLVPTLPARKKVAAHARILMDTERLSHSLSSQVSYYSYLIQNNPEWEYAGVYADEGITGTKTNRRRQFQQMLKACEEGKIDIILTKSISRFARNTVDLLETVRHLKELGISVRFEKEHIDSLSADGEVMRTILASFAQEEVRSISENVKWIRKKNFEKGIPQARYSILGYRWDGWDMVIVPEEAGIVREIFDRYLRGDSYMDIVHWLQSIDFTSSHGEKVTSRASLEHILRNETYVGDLLLQKSYVVDPISKKRKLNHGELPQYIIENHHEPIISRKIFEKTAAKRKEQKGNFYFINNVDKKATCFTSMPHCDHCGLNFFKANIPRPSDPGYVYWRCSSKGRKGAVACTSKGISNSKLEEMCCRALGIEEFDEDYFHKLIDDIYMQEDWNLRFHFKDNSEKIIERKQSPQDIGWNKRREAEHAKQES